MSSHREAPATSKDPVADNTDVYAWVDQNDPSMVNLIANFNPFEIPYGGPNFSEFADDVLYTIIISNQGDSKANIVFGFQFTTTIRNPNTFLYNTGPIASITDPNWNRPQTFTANRYERDSSGKVVTTPLGSNLLVPPVNVGERSTPKYDATYRTAAVQNLTGGGKIFAGQRADAFFVDLGSVFDLGGLRPLNAAHLIPLAKTAGINGLQGLNVHTIAMQIPIATISKSGTAPTDKSSADSVIGVYAAAFRNKSRIFDPTTGTYKSSGGRVQVSRLGNPLVNEVINPMASKDLWNSKNPVGDSAFANNVLKPELGSLLPVLYPGAFPNLAARNASGKTRDDLAAILLTGIPATVLAPLYPAPNTFGTFTGSTQADLLRLNLAVPPTAVGKENALGVIGGDAAGFPNGRRPLDDVTTIELRAIAGATIPLVDPTYKVDTVVSSVADGSSNTNPALLTVFPYLGTPNNGYDVKPPTPSSGS